VLILHVQVDDLLRRVRFYVTPGLIVPCILGCTFTNLRVKCTNAKERRVELNKMVSVAISSSASACQAVSTTRKPTSSTKVRIAHRISMPARCEALVEITTSVEGLRVLNTHYKHHSINLSSGVAEVRSRFVFASSIRLADRNLYQKGWSSVSPLLVPRGTHYRRYGRIPDRGGA
jgi:hypothetical protein